MRLKRVPPQRFLFLRQLPLEICHLIHQYMMWDVFKQLIKFTRGIRHHLLMIGPKYFVGPPYPTYIDVVHVTKGGREIHGIRHIRGYYTDEIPTVLKEGWTCHRVEVHPSTTWFGMEQSSNAENRQWKYKRCKKNWDVVRISNNYNSRTTKDFRRLCELGKQATI